MHALRVLEYETVLQQLSSHCESPLGATYALELLPSFDPADCQRSRHLTEEAFSLLAVEKLPSLGAIRDLREAATKAVKGATLDGLSLFHIGEALATMRSLKTILRPKRESFPGLWGLVDNLVEDTRTEELILRSIDSGGEVLDSATAELARLRKNARNAASRLQDKIQSYTTGASRDYLSDPIVTQRGGRYVVPVKAEHRGKIRGIVHDTSGSGQTLFVEPSDVVEIGNNLREAEAAAQAEVARILMDLSSRVRSLGLELVASIENSGQIDLILAKARHGYAEKGCIPESLDDAHLIVEKGRHPLLPHHVAVPLTIEVGGPFDGVLITGPNTGGKTVAMKAVGLFVAMSQSGMMVPASRARIGHFSQIWADIGDEQSLEQSLSTFSAHIKNIAEALNGLRKNALVILDEVGAGTDPAEGAALARSILHTIQAKGAKVLASTHYGELKLFAANTPGFQNCAMEFDLKTLQPTYRLLVGTPGASHALKVAERCGLPKSVVEQARQDQGVQAEDVAKMLEQLEAAQKRAQRAQSEADRLTHRLREVEAQAEEKLQQAEQIRRTAKQKISEAVEDEMRQIRLDAAQLFDRLKKSGLKNLDEARSTLNELNERGESLAKRTRPIAPTRQAVTIEKGMAVKVRGYSQRGTVLEEPRDGKAIVQVGPLRMTLNTVDLEPEVKPETPKLKARKSQQLEKIQTAHVELDLRGERAEDAENKLQRFIDDTILAGLGSVRIVHGKGEGILRKVTRETLKAHKGVQSFRDGDPEEGGQGVTVALLR